MAFLILDEADSIAATRETEQSHHEDKAGVNTLIQKIDQVRALSGRVLIFLRPEIVTTVRPRPGNRPARWS